MANTDVILSELIDQRNRVEAAIQTLAGTARRARRPRLRQKTDRRISLIVTSVTGGHSLSAAEKIAATI